MLCFILGCKEIPLNGGPCCPPLNPAPGIVFSHFSRVVFVIGAKKNKKLEGIFNKTIGNGWKNKITGSEQHRCRSLDNGRAGRRTGGTRSRRTCCARDTGTAGRTRVPATRADRCCAGRDAAAGRWWEWPVSATAAAGVASTGSTPVWPTACGGSPRRYARRDATRPSLVSCQSSRGFAFPTNSFHASNSFTPRTHFCFETKISEMPARNSTTGFFLTLVRPRLTRYVSQKKNKNKYSIRKI